MIETVPPQDLDLERSILAGSLLVMEPEYQDLVPEDFYMTAHQIIWRAVQRLVTRREPVDLVSVKVALGDEAAQIGGAGYLSSLVEYPMPVNPAMAVKRLRDYARLRRLLELGNSIMKRACAANIMDADDVIDKSAAELLALSSGKDTGVRHIEQVVNECVQRAQDLQQRGGITGVPTGFIDLDSYTCGFQPGDLILLAARPSMGKTALALNCVMGAAQAGYRVGLFSLEMSAVQVGNRLLSAAGKINGLKFRSGHLTEDDFDDLIEAASELSKLPIWVDDTSTAHYRELVWKMRHLKATHGLDIAWVDYLGFIDGDKDAGRVMEVQSISRALKAAAKELNIPIVLICQLSRLCEQRGKNKRPMLSDLRDSGALEQDADVVMFLFREHFYDETADPGAAELHIAKQRNGPTGVVPLVWLPMFTKFSSKAETK